MDLRCWYISTENRNKKYNILAEVSPDFTKNLRAFGCCSKFFKPWIQPIRKQGSSQSPASCQCWRLKTRSRTEHSCKGGVASKSVVINSSVQFISLPLPEAVWSRPQWQPLSQWVWEWRRRRRGLKLRQKPQWIWSQTDMGRPPAEIPLHQEQRWAWECDTCLKPYMNHQKESLLQDTGPSITNTMQVSKPLAKHSWLINWQNKHENLSINRLSHLWGKNAKCSLVPASQTG